MIKMGMTLSIYLMSNSSTVPPSIHMSCWYLAYQQWMLPKSMYIHVWCPCGWHDIPENVLNPLVNLAAWWFGPMPFCMGRSVQKESHMFPSSWRPTKAWVEASKSSEFDTKFLEHLDWAFLPRCNEFLTSIWICWRRFALVCEWAWIFLAVRKDINTTLHDSSKGWRVEETVAVAKFTAPTWFADPIGFQHEMPWSRAQLPQHPNDGEVTHEICWN